MSLRERRTFSWYVQKKRYSMILLTNEVMTKEICSQLLGIESIGLTAYEKLRYERFCMKTVRLSVTRRANLENFASVRKPSDLKKDSYENIKTQRCRVLTKAWHCKGARKVHGRIT